MSPESLTDIECSIEIDAPPARVWEVLVAPEAVSGWFGCLRFEGRVGHVFYMQPDPKKRAAGDIDGATHCEILEMIPQRLLRFSWYLPATPKTTVEMALKDLGSGKTRVSLTHSGWDQFPPQQVREIWQQLRQGWQSSVLPNLAAAAGAGTT